MGGARGAVTIDNDDDDDDDGQRTSVIVWMCFVTSSTSLDTPDCSSCPPPAGRMTHRSRSWNRNSSSVYTRTILRCRWMIACLPGMYTTRGNPLCADGVVLFYPLNYKYRTCFCFHFQYLLHFLLFNPRLFLPAGTWNNSNTKNRKWILTKQKS